MTTTLPKATQILVEEKLTGKVSILFVDPDWVEDFRKDPTIWVTVLPLA